MGITIKQIAEMLGVSRGTVDRAIHGREGVSPKIVEQVRKLTEEFDYRPNTVAKALKSAQTPMTFGVVLPGENRFYAEVEKGLDEAVKTYAPYGVNVLKMKAPGLTAQKQAAQLKQLGEMNVNGILMAAVDADAVRDEVDRLSDTIPVITFNTDLTDSKRICFIGQEHFAAGRTSGDLMGSMLERDGKIALLVGSRGMLAHMQRAQGFRSAIKEHGITGVLNEVYATHESDEIAYEIVTNLLKTYNDLVGIGVMGGGQVGAGNALADSGKAELVKMACFDTFEQTVAHVKNGVVDYTIAQDPFIQGYMPVKIMYEYLALDILPKWERIFTHIDIRLKDNVENKGYEVFTGLYSSKA